MLRPDGVAAAGLRPIAATDRRVRARATGSVNSANRSLVGAVHCPAHGWRAYAAGSDGADHVVVYQTVTRTERRPAAPEPFGIAGHWCGGDRDPRRASRSCSVRCQSTGRDAAGWRPVHRAGDKTWRVVPGTTPRSVKAPSKCSGIPSRSRTVLIPRCTAVTTHSPNGRPDVDQSQELDSHNPQFAFVRIDGGKPDFRISLVSPTTVRGCGYEFQLERPATTRRSAADHNRGCSSTRRAGYAEPFHSKVT